MALIRWDPAREVDSLQGEMNRVFDAFFGPTAGTASARPRRWIPPMDLVEKDDKLILRADLPGLDHDDVSIEIKDGVLTVSGERRAEDETKADGFYRVERSYGAFSRSLSLPEGIDAERVVAEFDRGVLEVTIPKPEERKPHRVEIAAGSLNGNAVEKEAQ